MISILYLCDDRYDFLVLSRKLRERMSEIPRLVGFRIFNDRYEITTDICFLKISFVQRDSNIARGCRYHKIYLDPSLAEDLLPRALSYINTEDFLEQHMLVRSYTISIRDINSLYKIDYNIFRLILELTKYELKANGNVNIISNKPSMTLKEIFINTE